MKKRGLGGNVNLFLSRTKSIETKIAANLQPAQESELQQVAVTLLQAGRYQPRKDFPIESLKELADSIRAQGIIQPIVVRRIVGERYEIIAGERRWRAAQLAELSEVPVLIKDISDEAALAMALIENIQRENLNPIEESIALQRLQDEFSMTHQQIAHAVGKSRTTVTNLLRLLSLPPEVKEFVEQSKLEMGHARALLTLPLESQLGVAQRIVTEGLSVRKTESLVQQLQKSGVKSPEKNQKIIPDTLQLQQKISEKLQAEILVQQRANGKGKIIISYNSIKELINILSKIQIPSEAIIK